MCWRAILWAALPHVALVAGSRHEQAGSGSCPSANGAALLQTRRVVWQAGEAASAKQDAGSCIEAVVVEPRRLPSIAVALESAAEVPVSDLHPRRIDVLTVAHGSENERYVHELVNGSAVLSQEERSGRLRFLNLHRGDLGGDLLLQTRSSVSTNFSQSQGDHLDYHDKYSRMLKSRKFWHQFRCDNILLMQSDSLLCRNSGVRLSEFLQYEFIGGHTPSVHHGARLHMNGGLSFRRRAGMLRCLEPESGQAPELAAEDSFFSSCTELKQPPVDVMDRFAIDNALKPISDTVPLGLHKPWAGGAGHHVLSNIHHCQGAQELQKGMVVRPLTR